MARQAINIHDIEYLLMDAVTGPKEDFLKLFLKAYSFPNSTIKKLEMAGPDEDGYCSIKQKLLYKELPADVDMERAYFDAVQHSKAKERFVIINNFERIMARDMRSEWGINVMFDELSDKYEFFLPWLGREVTDIPVENPADVKAAAKMGHLFESIIRDNGDMDREALNVFLTRILFCYFADDTGIFRKNQFMNSVIANTNEDGSDLGEYLSKLFAVLDMRQDERSDINACFKSFPYVDGGLFRVRNAVPRFTKTSRKKLVEGGVLNWAEISPDIFGSMFQTVIDPEQRRHLGQHYTSVPNIMKVLNPLFLDDLHAELDGIGQLPSGLNRDKKLEQFRVKLSRIKVFDPACGSGNFLILAYKELCRLEMEAISMYSVPELPFLRIQLDHFYGIEIDDFPCEVARLVLWLSQHQINMECFKKFGDSNPTLPLRASGHIVCGNALSDECSWDSVCPHVSDSITYIASNPPYLGRNRLSEQQRFENKRIMGYAHGAKSLDYVWCWIRLSAKYINCSNHRCEAALVTTNSVSMGAQVPAWLDIFAENCDISFVHRSFKWSNHAKDQAGVSVSIVGLKSVFLNRHKFIYDETVSTNVNSINPYFVDAPNAVVIPTNITPFNIKMNFGTMFLCGGNFYLTEQERDTLVKNYPLAKNLISKAIGAEEYLRNKYRWCLWIDDAQLALALSIPPIKKKLLAVKEYRENSKTTGDAYKYRERYWQTREHPILKSAILIPRVSSENRQYIPIGYLPKNTVVADSAFAIYDAPLWLFAILTSSMHMAWVKRVSGKLESRYRYSNTLCYNTFPFPDLSENKKECLKNTALAILNAREGHYEMTNAELYNTSTMPEDLRAAHEANDLLVDSFYKRTGFKNDEERLAELFKRYEQMTKEAR